MEAVAFFIAMGAFVLFILVLSVAPPSPKEQARDAKAYAEWLVEVYPGLNPRQAAVYRYRELLGQGYIADAKVKNEMRLARLVIDGWHQWDGAVK